MEVSGLFLLQLILSKTQVVTPRVAKDRVPAGVPQLEKFLFGDLEERAELLPDGGEALRMSAFSPGRGTPCLIFIIP